MKTKYFVSSTLARAAFNYSCLIFALAGAGCSTNSDTTGSDARKLQGAWALVFQANNGKKLPDEKMAEMFHGKMFFEGDKIHYLVDLQGFDFQFTFILNPNHQPKEIDLRLTNSPDKQGIGQDLFGIYRLREDMLEICYNKDKRPIDFTAGDGSNNQLIVLKRDKS